MMRTRVQYLTVALLLLLAVPTQAARNGELNRRHHLEVQLGVWNHNHEPGIETSIGDPGLELNANGLTGGLSYGYFLSEALSVNLNVGLRSVEAEAAMNWSDARLDAVSVVHVLFGIKYYLPRSTYDSRVRPYLIADVGPYIGSEAWIHGWADPSVGTGSESAIGARLGGGVTMLIGSRTTLGASLGYHLMTDFERPIGGLRNFSGPQFTIGFGYLFGRS